MVNMQTSIGHGETILIVDDNETLRSLMVEALTELGYRALDALDAKAAIEILKSDQPINLLVTDVGLPNMNGRQLAEIARQQRPALKVLFVTGYAENAAARGEFLAPGMEMLTKPVSLTALSEKIQTLLTN